MPSSDLISVTSDQTQTNKDYFFTFVDIRTTPLAPLEP